MQFSPPGSLGIWFLTPTFLGPMGNPLKMRLVGRTAKKWRFSTNKSLYLGTDRRRTYIGSQRPMLPLRRSADLESTDTVAEGSRSDIQTVLYRQPKSHLISLYE